MTADGGYEERDAVAALERLGLSNYEARVLIALQKLGVGTAKEVHDEAGVPRSQVYGAAEQLQNRGLVELQESTPKRYRPVDPEAAQERLMAQIRRERELAFDYLESVHGDPRDAETRDDVWTVRGSEAITARVIDLLAAAQERVVIGASSPDLVSPDVRAAVEAACEAGVEVSVVSHDPDVRALFADTAARVPPVTNDGGTAFPGRVLVADDRIILLSVRADDASTVETAIWSADTELAEILVRMADAGIDALFG